MSCLVYGSRHQNSQRAAPEMRTASRMLITGAGGFIGSHVTELLLREGHQVRALVRYNGRGDIGHLRHVPQNLRAGLKVQFGDITDPFLVRELVLGCDVVLHLAALIGIPYSYIAPASYLATNAGGTLNVLEACRQAEISRVVLTRPVRLPQISWQRLTIVALICQWSLCGRSIPMDRGNPRAP
jgi:FlaA1/EpsC-like NDP-sugar epimerase